MFSTLSRSWALTKQSFAVIDKDKEMLLFALIGGVLGVAWFFALAAVLVAFSMNGSFDIDQVEGSVLDYALGFVLYLGLAFVGAFTKVCITYTTKIRFEGGDATFGESIRFALSRLGQIAGWAVAGATVGLLLYALSELADRLGTLGKSVVRTIEGMLGGLWEVLTAFVVPVMVYEGVGPIDAFKTSARLFKKTWGESLVKQIGFGWVQGLAAFGVTALGGALLFAFHEPPMLWLPVGVLVLGHLAVGLLFAVASAVYDTALYVYATQDREVGFERETMAGAFEPDFDRD